MPYFVRSLTVAVAASALLALAGCGDRPQTAPTTTNSNTTNAAQLPDWAQDPTMAGKYPIAAVGTAEKSMASFAMQRDRALANGRTELGRALETKVQAIFKDWTREGGEITSQDNRQMAMTMAENISRNVTTATVQATSQRALFTEQGTGRLFVWVYLDSEAQKQVAAMVKAKTREEMEKRAHFAAKVEADKAFAELDKLVDKELAVADGK